MRWQIPTAGDVVGDRLLAAAHPAQLHRQVVVRDGGCPLVLAEHSQFDFEQLLQCGERRVVLVDLPVYGREVVHGAEHRWVVRAALHLHDGDALLHEYAGFLRITRLPRDVAHRDFEIKAAFVFGSVECVCLIHTRPHRVRRGFEFTRVLVDPPEQQTSAEVFGVGVVNHRHQTRDD